MQTQKLKKIKLACSAQTFGFGPISKLFSIARALGNTFSLILFLDSDRNVFPSLNPGIFDEVYYTPKIQDLERAIAEIKPAAILSSYEPDSVLAGRRNGIPSYFIDGLFWFWKLSKSMNELYQYGEKLVYADKVDELIKHLTPHERIFISHFLAKKSYIQYDPDLSERLEEVKKYNTAINLVGAILNNAYEGNNTLENHLLVTLGGEILPTVTVDQSAMYAQLIIEMVERASEKYFKDREWIVLVNPLVRDKLAFKNNGNVRIKDSVSQETMYSLQKLATLVFSPPGLTTTYECASLEKPVVFLPEQSIQYKNAYRLQNHGFPLHGAFFHDIDSREDPNEDGLGLLYKEKIPKFLADQSAIFERVFGCCRKMEDANYRRHVASVQRKAVLNMVGNFNGTEEIAASLKKEIFT